MTKTLYLDCFSGASGDMFIGALLDCGLDFEYLKSALAGLGVDGYKLSLSRVDKSGISASKFDVNLEHRNDHGHRHLSEIIKIIESSSLSDGVKERALAIFQLIGKAESKIHNIPIEKVHFHEVGAIDSIVDIVGACIGLEAMSIDKIISSPLHVGSGTFKCAHGTYPVPGPATAEILHNVPVYSKDIEGELVTPTGAAIIATLAAEFGPMPMMRIEKVGYGAGTRDYPKFPNVLRAIIGYEIGEADLTPGTITVIEANVDDLSPQVLGYLMDKALEEAALDIFFTPVQMKKNRPGVLLTLLCRQEDREKMTGIIFSETTTLGVRYRVEKREILVREHQKVETPYGPIRIKVARKPDGTVTNSTPEFDDCRAAAEKHHVALRDVQLAAMKAFESD